MTDEEQQWRALVGADGVRAARESAAAAPKFSPEMRDRLALLFRTLRRKPHVDTPEHRDDVA